MKRRFATVGVVLMVVGLAVGGVVLAGGNEETADHTESLAGADDERPDHTESLDACFREVVRTSDFVLSVEAPKEVRAGRAFALKATLEYIGEENIRLFHGSPVVLFYIVDGDGRHVANDLFAHPRVYLDIGVITPLEPGQKMKVEDMWRVDHPGEYQLIAATTLLANECPWEKLFEGKNYERFIRDDMTERVEELTRSRIATAPMEIIVING